MIKQHPLLTRGIEAAKAGDRAKARRLLTQAIRRDPDSVEAWLWLSGAIGTPQGRVFCLEKVLSIDPTNRPAQRGLAALGAAQVPLAVSGTRPAQPPLTPQSPPVEIAPQAVLASPAGGERVTAIPMPVARPALPGRPAPVWSQPRFWRAVVICLGAVALALAGILAYDAIRRPTGEEVVAVGLPAVAESPDPQRTLRPTFTTTPLPTDVPLPTDTATPPPTPTFTETPTPSPTPTATLTLTPQPTRRSVRLTPTAAATSTPRPTLAPPIWDPRLTMLGVRLEPAAIPPGVGYWRLVEARWSDEHESAGKHTIYVEVLDPHGGRVAGQPVIIEWPSGSLTLPIENRPPPDWGVNFPMFATLGSYSARVGVESSDRVVGMGMGTVENPNFTVHTSFYLIFRWAQR